LTREEILTKWEFSILLNEFRFDTPEKIIKIFKESVIFDQGERTSFKWVKPLILFQCELTLL